MEATNSTILIQLSSDTAEALMQNAIQCNQTPSELAAAIITQNLIAPAHNPDATMLKNIMYLQLCTLYWCALHWSAGPPKRRLSAEGLNHFTALSRDFANGLLPDFLPKP